jgi:hypothetical protein
VAAVVVVAGIIVLVVFLLKRKGKGEAVKPVTAEAVANPKEIKVEVEGEAGILVAQTERPETKMEHNDTDRPITGLGFAEGEPDATADGKAKEEV